MASVLELDPVQSLSDVRVVGADSDNPTQAEVEGLCARDRAHLCLLSALSGVWTCLGCEATGQLANSRLSLPLGPEPPRPELPVNFGRTASDLLAEQPEDVNWLVPGLLAPGWSLKLAAREKTGKGTFVAYLIGCLERDAATVFGQSPGRPVTSLILTEEPVESMREKLLTFLLRRSLIVSGYELAGCDWDEKVRLLVARAVEEGHEVIFVDNISRAAAIEDENGTELGRACEQLIDRARKNNIACILDHHHKKGGGALEDKSRGGTALAGAVDVNVEMQRDGDWTSRRRRLSTRGRLRATIWELTVELPEDSAEYVVVGNDSGPVLDGLGKRDVMRRAFVAALREREGEWLKTGDARELVSGNNTTKGQVLRELAESDAWPVRSRKSETGGVEYTYDYEAQARLLSEVLGGHS